MSLDGDSVEATVALHYDGTSSESGAVERDDGRSSTSAEQSGDGASNGSGEEIPSGSVGRATVPQFIDGHLHVDGDAPKRSPSTGSENDDDGAGDCEADIEIARSMVRSETEEFASSVMDAGGNVEYNVKDVATETVKWLAHRLGPVLTAKYLSRNLLRMLALCYLGEEQLKPVKDMRNELSTTHVNVVGDEHATRVLDCLTCVAILYGEHIILLQYFQHIREQICVAVKKLTSKAEAGLVGCLQLLTHILPYLSDSTLMDILQETIFKDIILPILKIVSSAHISFPTRSQARSVICYKIIDALYVISLRIGFEMTRGHMTFVLQKFFAAFNRVHAHTDEETADLSSEGTMGSPNVAVTDKQALEENLYFEIKMDSQTKEYHIGTPIAVDSFLQHQRQNSGSSMKHSLSPPAHEDIEESPQFGEVNREQILGELRETFTPQLAHAAYIPFCRLAGDIHMEQNLINDDLIRRLCASHDQALSQQQFVHTELLTPDTPPYTNVDESCGEYNGFLRAYRSLVASRLEAIFKTAASGITPRLSTATTSAEASLYYTIARM
ncbi:WD repeat-containing protein 81 [Lamellibrachia satsuma]|nr:WD repeat-containing protein 81 [Lamellibrachia satsuma]